jgi:hypothetical protein
MTLKVLEQIGKSRGVFIPSLMFASKARAYPNEAPLWLSLRALSTNIRLGFRRPPGDNALAYWVHSYVTKCCEYGP